MGTGSDVEPLQISQRISRKSYRYREPEANHMKLKIAVLTLLCAAFGGSLFAQKSPSNPVGANITVADAGTCSTVNSFLWQQLPNNAGTTTVNLAGTFVATVTIRESNNGGSTWTTATTLSAAGTTTFSTNGFTDICADVTAYTSGTVQVSLSTGLQQVQSVISGGSGSSSASAPIMALYFTAACPVSNTANCFFTPANTQLANDCTWSNAATDVNCATAHFVATDAGVGKRVAGYFKTDTFGSIFGCVAGRVSFSSMTTGTLTIATFISPTHIQLSGNPANTATGNNGCFIWGNPDDATAATFETTYAAISSFCPKVMLAASGYWFSSPHFSSNPAGCVALSSLIGASTTSGNMVYTAGFELEGRGPGNTVIYLGPDFPAAGGNLCTNTQGSISNACFLVPVEGKWSDLQINGGGQLACQVGLSKILLGVTTGTLQNISLINMCQNSSGGQIGIKADLLAQLYQVNNSGFGAVCLQTIANQPYVQAFKLGCENSPGGITGSSIEILADGGTTPTFTCWGCLLLGSISSTSMNVVSVGAGATVRINGGAVANCEAGSGCTTTATALFKNNGGNLYLTDVTGSAQGGAALVGGLNCAAANSNNYLERTILANIANSNYGGNNAGCTLYDLGGNGPLFTGIANNALSGTVVADGRSVMFNCTGTANASATNSLYGTGPNVTGTTCAAQTATLGTGIPFQQARTIAGIICTSSATTVSVACTVVINGTPASTTCTMTAAVRCSNFTTTAVQPADLLSARIVTGAAETGANIKMQVIWQ